jgi:hypothetical protein
MRVIIGKCRSELIERSPRSASFKNRQACFSKLKEHTDVFPPKQVIPFSQSRDKQPLAAAVAAFVVARTCHSNNSTRASYHNAQ